MSSFVNPLVPLLQVRSKSIICYDQFDFPPSGKRSLFMAKVARENWRENTAYSGNITNGSKKRLSKAVSLLVQSSPKQRVFNPVSGKFIYFKLSFITLTIPVQELLLSAKYCHKNLLQPLLRKLRNKYGLKSYVWKCELQANGMVHYHLTSSLFIVHTDLRDEWNNILRREGLLKSFKAKQGHDNPNSIDIHAVTKVKDMEAYLIKYIAKEYQNFKSLDSKVWDCSKNLKEASYFTTIRERHYERVLSDAVSKREADCYIGDRYRIYKFKTKMAPSILTDDDYKDYQSLLKSIRLCQNNSPKSESTTCLTLSQVPKTQCQSMNENSAFVPWQMSFDIMGVTHLKSKTTPFCGSENCLTND